MVKKIPTYDYECKDCKTKLLIVANIKDTVTEPACEDCKKAMTRKYNFGAVTFKGSGFYRTDRNKKEE